MKKLSENKTTLLYSMSAFVKRNSQRMRWIALFSLLFFVHWTNTFHTNFPDEFDNIVGGWYMTRGLLPYRDFFSHHNPAAYVIAACITFFTQQSFVHFRMVWAGVIFAFTSFCYLFLKRHFNISQKYIVFGTFLTIAISATYYWGHMLLAETVVGYALLPVYILLVFLTFSGKPLRYRDLIFISLLTAIALLTSFTFIFAVGIILGYTLYLFFKNSSFSLKKTGWFILIFALPYLSFFLYLLATKNVHEFYFDSIVYNREYYIYNFPVVAGQVSKNPVRFAISIFYTVSIQFYSLLVNVRQFNFSYPVNVALILGNVTLLLYTLTKRKFLLSISIYTFIVFLNARGEPLNSAETDFHSTVYIMISIFNGIYGFWEWTQLLEKKITNSLRFLAHIILFISGVYFLFTGLFFLRGYTDKVYARFMGNAPAIYDTPVVAPIINAIVGKDDYFWIGPFEFQELLYINGKLPSKYHWFLPASSRSEKITRELTSDLLQHPPKVIVFKEDYGVFGVTPADFNGTIVTILRSHYFRLKDLEEEGKYYQPVNTNLHNFDIAENFYFDRNRKDEIIALLLDQKIIKSTK